MSIEENNTIPQNDFTEAILDTSIASILGFTRSIYTCFESTGELPPWFGKSGLSIPGLSPPTKDEIYRVMKYLHHEMWTAGINDTHILESGLFDDNTALARRLFIQSFAPMFIMAAGMFSDYITKQPDIGARKSTGITKISHPDITMKNEIMDEQYDNWADKIFRMPDFIRCETEDKPTEEPAVEQPEPISRRIINLDHANKRNKRYIYDNPNSYQHKVREEFRWKDDKWWWIYNRCTGELKPMSYSYKLGYWTYLDNDGKWKKYHSTTRIFPPRPRDHCDWQWYCE
jgi:hypothetical protein